MFENKDTKQRIDNLGPASWDAYYQAEAHFKTFDPKEDPNEEMRIELALNLLEKASDVKRILDVGCGEGFLMNILAVKYNAQVAGLDISETRIARARANCPRGNFAIGDIRKLPYADSSMDLVSAIEVLEHIVPPEAALIEMARVSSKYVLVSVPFEQPPKIVICPHCLQTFAIDGHLTEFTTEKIHKLMHQSGVVPTKTVEYIVPSHWSRSSLLRLLPGPVKMNLERLLVRTGLMSRRVPKFIGVLGKIKASRACGSKLS